jgi:hypothetical protein
VPSGLPGQAICGTAVRAAGSALRAGHQTSSNTERVIITTILVMIDIRISPIPGPTCRVSCDVIRCLLSYRIYILYCAIFPIKTAGGGICETEAEAETPAYVTLTGHLTHTTGPSVYSKRRWDETTNGYVNLGSFGPTTLEGRPGLPEFGGSVSRQVLSPAHVVQLHRRCIVVVHLIQGGLFLIHAGRERDI